MLGLSKRFNCIDTCFNTSGTLKVEVLSSNCHFGFELINEFFMGARKESLNLTNLLLVRFWRNIAATCTRSKPNMTVETRALIQLELIIGKLIELAIKTSPLSA